MFIAHALEDKGRLYQDYLVSPKIADFLIWATGIVDQYNFTAGIVEGIEDKLNSSMDAFNEAIQQNQKILVCLPKDNASSLSKEMRTNLEEMGIEILPVAKINSLLKRLDLPQQWPISLQLGLQPFTDQWNTVRHHAIIATAVVPFFLGGAYWFDQNRIKTKYFANYTTRWGVPVGVGELDLATVQNREHSFIFNSRGGQVISIKRINSKGKLSNNMKTNGESQQKIYYSDKNLSQIKYFDHNDRLIMSMKYDFFKEKTEAKVSFHTGYGKRIFQAQDWTTLKSNKTVRNRSDTASYRLTFNIQGITIKQKYKNIYGDDTKNSEGSYGKIFSWKKNKDGTVITEKMIDKDGNSITSKRGVSFKKKYYSKWADLLSETWHDKNGNLRRNDAGFSVKKNVLDQYGNIVQTSYYNSQGQLTNSNKEFAIWKAKFNNGHRISSSSFDSKKKPVLRKDGYARWEGSYNEYGYVVEERYLDKNGSEIILKKGYSRVSYEYDSKGNITKKTFFYQDNKIVGKDGYAVWKSKYDKIGRRIETSLYDEKGNLASYNNDGYSIVKIKYDNQNYPVEEKYYDKNKNLYFKKINRYDKYHNLTVVQNFNGNNNPSLDSYGVHKLVQEFDHYGNLTKKSFFGKTGKLTLNSEGIAIVKNEYDKKGNLIDVRYLGSDEKPASATINIMTKIFLFANFSINFVSRISRAYDERGNVIEESIFDINGKSINFWGEKSNVEKYNIAYDKKNNIIEYTAIDIDGNITPFIGNVAQVKIKEDNRGNLLKISYFNKNGNAAAGDILGHSSQEFEYDDFGNTIKHLMFQGKVISLIRTFQYGIAGNITKEFWDSLGKTGLSNWEKKFDKHGNIIEEAFWDTKGNPAIGGEGFSHVFRNFDEQGNIIKESYFGVDHKPILSIEGFTRIERKFDNLGNIIDERIFGVDGKPILNSNGCAKTVSKYDNHANRIEKSCFNTDGHPVLDIIGCATIVYKFNKNQKEIERSCFGIDRKPIKNKQGIAKLATKYNHKKQKISVSFYGVNGDLYPIDNVAIVKYDYDEYGNKVENSYYGVNSKPVQHSNGCAKRIFSFDFDNNNTGKSCFDIKGRKVKISAPKK